MKDKLMQLSSIFPLSQGSMELQNDVNLVKKTTIPCLVLTKPHKISDAQDSNKHQH